METETADSKSGTGAIREQCLLGTPLCLTTYEEFSSHCLSLARQPRPTSVEFSNTQIVTLRRHEPAFREVTSRLDYSVPDGMPLIWCLNLKGAELHDRVYGPTFMRRFLSTSPVERTHYLLGGSAECGARLREVFGRLNPAVRFVGSFHGLCRADGTLEGDAEREVVAEINRLSPDFIWVGLGTPKQQAWMHRHKPQIKRGVLLGVGFAFDANAGLKPDAPLWMQRAGLTWFFRMLTEPKRLGPRYVRYNSLFLFYLFWDLVRGRAFAPLRPVDHTAP